MGLKCFLGLLLAQGRWWVQKTLQESIKPAKVMRGEATFTHKVRKHTDFKNKTTKSVLPHIWFDADYCTEMNLGFMSLRMKISKILASTGIFLIQKTILNNFDCFWKPASWLSEGFLRLLILACKGEVPQEECWNQVPQQCANIIL